VREVDWVIAAKAGDRRALEYLARRYNEELLSYFRSRIGDEVARDLTQLTLLHTVAKIRRFRGESSFRYYVFSVARRVMFEWSRRAGRRVDTEPLPSSSSEPAADDTPLSERLFHAEFYRQLGQALASLAEHYREVVQLHLSGLKNPEIAGELGIEYNTVRSRLSRGLAFIRARLDPWLAESRRPMPLEFETVSTTGC
jgi:RNA polymerase sigma-70 factor, ECF subfamily